MEISVSNKKILVKELKSIASNMDKVSNEQQKMYFFSAVFGIVNRIMNLEFDPELGFIHHVTYYAYNSINANLIASSKGQSMPTIPPQIFSDHFLPFLLARNDCWQRRILSRLIVSWDQRCAGLNRCCSRG